MTLDDAIRRRHTEKVLALRDLPVVDCRQSVDELLELAGLAPFHRACDDAHRQSSELAGIEPWRFYALDAAACRRLRSQIPLEKAGKIPSMLAAADALIMATWLPSGTSSTVSGAMPAGGEEPNFPVTLTNMEHIAATAAAIQNLLLAATARGIANYWSSGGVLRSPAVFSLLGIPLEQILLGAVFLFPAQTSEAERVTSKLRDRRTAPPQWSRWVSF